MQCFINAMTPFNPDRNLSNQKGNLSLWGYWAKHTHTHYTTHVDLNIAVHVELLQG